ncbi:hypothetical protein HPB50_011955 [Hyalomma asiaticum]|uniref:Uncharacterized protein n=1 Tax=Hyalomma asiaticum TaxID=266040 RepID=A0ACB7TA91_HYAAI|nr:hypothetical protein HPB50_011955 [Hyalomma asiaticum]
MGRLATPVSSQLATDVPPVFQHLFDGELGLVRDFIHLVKRRQHIAPVSAKLRRLPLALRQQVAKVESIASTSSPSRPVKVWMDLDDCRALIVLEVAGWMPFMFVKLDDDDVQKMEATFCEFLEKAHRIVEELTKAAIRFEPIDRSSELKFIEGYGYRPDDAKERFIEVQSLTQRRDILVDMRDVFMTERKLRWDKLDGVVTEFLPDDEPIDDVNCAEINVTTARPPRQL